MITNLAGQGLPRNLNNPAQFQQPPVPVPPGAMMCQQFPNRFVYDDLHWTTSWELVPAAPAHPLYGRYQPRPHITLSIILPAAATAASVATIPPHQRIILRIHYGYTQVNEPNPIFWASVSRNHADICKSEKGNRAATARPDLIGTRPNLWRPATLHFVSFCLLTGRPPPRFWYNGRLYNYPPRDQNTWPWGAAPTNPLRVTAVTVADGLLDRLHFIYTTITDSMTREWPPDGVPGGQLVGGRHYTSLFLNGSSFPADDMSGIQTVTAPHPQIGTTAAVVNPLSLAHIDFDPQHANIDQAIQLCWDVYHFIRQGNAAVIRDTIRKLMANPDGDTALRRAARQINVEPEFENGTSDVVSELNGRNILIQAMDNMLDPVQHFARRPTGTRTPAAEANIQGIIDRFLAMVGHEHAPVMAVGRTIVDHPGSGLTAAMNTVRHENSMLESRRLDNAIRSAMTDRRRLIVQQRNQERIRSERARHRLRQRAEATARTARDAADQEACGDTCHDFEEWVADEDADEAEQWEAGNAFWRHVNAVGGVRGQRLKEQIRKGEK